MHDNSALGTVDATEKAFASGGGKGLIETLSVEQKKLYDTRPAFAVRARDDIFAPGRQIRPLRYLKKCI